MSFTIGLVGGGSWATALAYILTHNGHRVRWWVRRPEVADSLRTRGHNPRYLSWVQLPIRYIHPSSHLPDVLKGIDNLLVVVPAAFLQPILPQIVEMWRGPVAFAVKGLVANELPPAAYMYSHWNIPQEQLTVFGGPTHAEEVVQHKHSFLTIASYSNEQRNFWQEALTTSWFATLPNTDPFGVEWAGVLKNVYAIGVGIAVGLGFGDNLVAILVSQAAQEMERFLSHVVPGTRNLLESAYLGDLLVTAYSQHSRNRTLGVMLGRGYSPRAAIAEMGMIPEGYFACQGTYRHAKEKDLVPQLPFLHAIYNVLHRHVTPVMEYQLLIQTLRTNSEAAGQRQKNE